MVKNKYDKNFISEPKPGDQHKDTDLVKFPFYVDAEVVPGAYYLMAASFLGTTGQGAPPVEHTHDFNEYLIFLGTNQKDPRDLGGEVEVWLGGEKHIITKSCAVFVPAGTKHAPIYFKRIDTPIWYLATGTTPKYIVAPDIKEDIQEARKEKA
jgi:mannose-6-phosphate isomerase-like protein (cupin superfamily)